MNGTITTWFDDKGFGFIKDENGDNRYFHVIKVASFDLIKKDVTVTFEPIDAHIDKENTVLYVCRCRLFDEQY
ncbi:cold-shock protein [Providencia burhodogranariea DSM 19968]|uniref:Cold-shock protein n=1 Tax=Providencia burhodogranariea DSM 19968 TaxID=1141662 RepID=K8WF24_9GAMM|nr:cold-shock protein [Providencia burhodogranariea DSM 19968]